MMRAGAIVVAGFLAAGCGVKGPPLPPVASTTAGAEERLSVTARRVGGEWSLRAALSRPARFTIVRRGADCPEGRLVLVTDGTTREVEVREARAGRQRFTVVAVVASGEKFERSVELEGIPR